MRANIEEVVNCFSFTILGLGILNNLNILHFSLTLREVKNDFCHKKSFLLKSTVPMENVKRKISHKFAHTNLFDQYINLIAPNIGVSSLG